MSRKQQREKDEERMLQIMDELEKVSWNADRIDEALALAWKYLNLSKRQALEIQALRERIENGRYDS